MSLGINLIELVGCFFFMYARAFFDFTLSFLALYSLQLFALLC